MVIQRWRIVALGFFVLGWIGACGGSSSPASPSPQPYNETVNGTVSTAGYNYHPVVIPRSGNMTVTLTWQTTADLDLYLTASSCADIYASGSCQMLAVSDRASGSSEVITRSVQQGEQFKLWVDNFSLAPQTYSLHFSIQ